MAVLALLTSCTNTDAPVNREGHSGSSSAAVVAGVQEITIDVDNSFRFTPSTITVHRGRVKVTLHHLGPGAPHNWQLTGIPGDYVATVWPGQTASVSFVAPAPGSYEFVCTIHQRQGQTGTMVVLPN
ncbi:MAG: cupredoxin domain-containing protein [Actinomycetota bacterium]|nr:cupredoxin domain-containing protein [Actinomycetota bacterium]